MSVSEIFDPEQGGCDLCSDQKVSGCSRNTCPDTAGITVQMPSDSLSG
jgi:hypothetical protein